jgi:hypothetical protein
MYAPCVSSLDPDHLQAPYKFGFPRMQESVKGGSIVLEDDPLLISGKSVHGKRENLTLVNQALGCDGCVTAKTCLTLPTFTSSPWLEEAHLLHVLPHAQRPKPRARVQVPGLW